MLIKIRSRGRTLESYHPTGFGYTTIRATSSFRFRLIFIFPLVKLKPFRGCLKEIFHLLLPKVFPQGSNMLFCHFRALYLPFLIHSFFILTLSCFLTHCSQFFNMLLQKPAKDKKDCLHSCFYFRVDLKSPNLIKKKCLISHIV